MGTLLLETIPDRRGFGDHPAHIEGLVLSTRGELVTELEPRAQAPTHEFSAPWFLGGSISEVDWTHPTLGKPLRNTWTCSLPWTRPPFSWWQHSA